MKVYSGAPAAARCYVEADRGRADDYYLAEGTGVARRFTATEGRVSELVPLTGDAYKTWVAGRDPATEEPRGRLRTDERAVRFVEVVVNGPKTWSLAAALHPDIAAAYEAAQDRAATQIVGWLSVHATTRVGPAGGQVQVPVEALEAATVRHYTSRTNDPHWHLHLQINARVFAAGKWRGLHTVGVRDFLGAINGIGHATMATDPVLNAALAVHGYTKDASGEIRQLADYVGPFSARHAQIARNVDRYESEWAAAHPGEAPGPALRRAWDARAWAEGRPDKVTPQLGLDIRGRWRSELQDLGFRPPTRPVPPAPTLVGALDRDELAARALTRLAAARSAWNTADVRGEVERLIAAAGVVVEAAVRIELAEDLTARAMRGCVPLLHRDGIPEHIRAVTSTPVLTVEAELTTRLAARAAERSAGVADADLTLPSGDLTRPVEPAGSARRLDAGQAAAVAVLAADRPLVVIEGAAGAGKTTTLAATRRALEARGRRLVVVTPTLKAAKVAAAEIGAAAGSAARLAFQYGWRWNDDGRWIRLAVGQTDLVTGRTYAGPAAGARLRSGDLLVVDEAGMLDQDTARALLTIADECQMRVALLGDRHQLAAVGRGGVLDVAVGQVDPAGHLTLAGVHRFTRADTTGQLIPDSEYADLTLAMRVAENPGAVFDALFARGQIRLQPNEAALREALAATVADSSSPGSTRVAIVVDTREQAAELNAAIRDRLVTAGRVDDRHAVIAGAGQRIGAGDRITTRRNDRDLGVANRDTWIVTGVARDGGLLVAPEGTPAGMVGGNIHGDVPPAGSRQRVLPADYVTAHVELGYASTAHGAQGDTVTAAHLVLGEHTGAATAYVGMTRGRQANTAHLIAADETEAREQWIAVFARDRADLGPAHAARLAAAEAARYAPPRPLEDILAELEQARSVQQRCRQRLAAAQPRRDALAALVGAGPDPGERLEELQAAHRQALRNAEEAQRLAEAADAAITAEATPIRDELLEAWHTQRPAAAGAARALWQGPGRFGLHRGAVIRAAEQLTAWADSWRPLLPDMPTDPRRIAEIAGHTDHPLRPGDAFAAVGRARAEHAHPHHAALTAAAAATTVAEEEAARAVADARRDRDYRLLRFGRLTSLPDPAASLADLDRDLAAIRAELTAAQDRIARLTAEPGYRNQPPDRHPTDQSAADRLSDQRAGRRSRVDGDRPPRRPVTPPRPLPEPSVRRPRHEDLRRYGPQPGHGRGIGR